jgi:exodeoxyribonuclease VII small subunit
MAKIPTTSSLNFTQALSRLEEIVVKLEQPDLDLEDGLSLLEEGVRLHKLCKQKLTDANVKITSILKDGNSEKHKEEDVPF